MSAARVVVMGDIVPTIKSVLFQQTALKMIDELKTINPSANKTFCQ